MRKHLSLVVIILMLFVNASSPGTAQASQLLDLLPKAGDISTAVFVADEGVRTLDEQAATFADPTATERWLADWGWQGNAFRFYETSLDTANGTPDSTIEISLTRFASVNDAANALPYFLEDRAALLNQHETQPPRLVGDEARAINGMIPGGYDFTLYVRSGTLLMRISARAAVGSPVASPDRIAEDIIENAALVSSSEGGQLPIGDYIPDTLPLDNAACFRIDGEGTLDFTEVVDRFPGVPDASTTLQSLGWEDGAYRQFGCDTPRPGSVGWIDMSVHRFRDASSADAAVAFFASSRALGTSLLPAPAMDLGEANAALAGPAINGMEYTLYVSAGPLLFRVTGVAPFGDPRPNVEYVSSALYVLGLIKSAQIPSTDLNTGAPTLTPYPTSVTLTTPPPTATFSPTPIAVPTTTPIPTTTSVATATHAPTQVPTRAPQPTSTPRATETPIARIPTLAPISTVAEEVTTCTMVELYPGYPGYRGYIAGLDGPGEVACLEELSADDPGFDKDAEDAANITAARAIGLNGFPVNWTWENWMAVEGQRGLPPTCYSCLIFGESLDHKVAAYDPSDPRLWFGGFGTTNVVGVWDPSLSATQFNFDHRLRGFIGVSWPGNHAAPEVADLYDELAVQLGAPGMTFFDPQSLWIALLDQGGYVPTPATASLGDQLYTVGVGAEAIFASMASDVCQTWLNFYEGTQQTYINELSTGESNLPYADWLRENLPTPFP